MISVEVRGARQFQDLAARLKAAGDGRLIKELRSGMRKAARPALEEAQANVRNLKITGLPHPTSPERDPKQPRRRTRGSGRYARYEYAVSRSKRATEAVKKRAAGRSGLREAAARATGIEVNAAPKTARVRIRCRRTHMPPDQQRLPGHMNKGKWRKPLFGDREVWTTNLAEPAWFDDAAPKAGPKCRAIADVVLADINAKIVS